MSIAQTESRLKPQPTFNEIERLDRDLMQHFKSQFVVQPSLRRSLVSFQANKTRAAYRWYKYKEAFSASLMEYLLQKYHITSGKVLDPFAGSGTTLFAASAAGVDAEGIELLPIGQHIIATRLLLENEFTADDFTALRRWAATCPWEHSAARYPLPELRITHGAYPAQTHEAIERYMGALQQENERAQVVLCFALLCVLESISYTRKDGQYLRWDYRSGRRQGTKIFDKGAILDLAIAISAKLDEIISDMQVSGMQTGLFSFEHLLGNIALHSGSCLEILPTLPSDAYSAIITSPPYCNRYDYTRTYALELALLSIGQMHLLLPISNNCCNPFCNISKTRKHTAR